MPETNVSAHDPYERRRVGVLDIEMAYVDTGGSGDAVVFLHGNPTSSYLWRNIIPHVAPLARCLAPDLIGMGDSGPAGDGSYRFVDHRRYLEAWLDAVLPSEWLTFVIHDWGSALGFDWSRRHSDRVQGLAFMEAIVQPISWEDFPEYGRGLFQGFRSEAGEDLVLEKNMFVAWLRTSDRESGESRRPTLTWPRELPIEGEPADVVQIVKDYGAWLRTSDVPKLLIAAKPGALLTGRPLEFARSWPNTTEVAVEGVHFVQEDSPQAIGEAIAGWYRDLA